MGVVIPFPTPPERELRRQREADSARQRELERRNIERQERYERASPSYHGLALGPSTKSALARAGITLDEAAAMSDERLREQANLGTSSLETLRRRLRERANGAWRSDRTDR